MKKNPNINKYYNRTPKGFALFFLILYMISGIASLVICILTPGIPIGTIIGTLVWSVVLVGLLYYLYIGQVTLVRARMGKHLTKYHGLVGDALVATIDSIDKEIGRPVYADASNKRKYNAFFVTENWLVGTDGVMLLRANACKRADIKSIEKTIYERHRKGVTMYYHILLVTDKNDYKYEFFLRNEQNLDMAYDFLMNNSNA